MPRKKPFSCKQKKQQLQEKKLRKQAGPKYLADLSDSDDDNSTLTATKNSTDSTNRPSTTESVYDGKEINELDVQKINQQPERPHNAATDLNSFRLHFFKESDEVINRRKKDARRPVKTVEEKYLEYRTEDVYPENAYLDFPKRPPWNYHLSKEQLQEQEKRYFSSYLQEVIGQTRSQDLSYFELNLETWRQLWRVLEMSDVLLVIADIRYPVLHISPNFINYIIEELQKDVVIILNKVDFVSPALAVAWKQYIQTKFPNVPVVFFSSYPRDLGQEDLLNLDPGRAYYKRPFQGKHKPMGPAELLKVCKSLTQDKVDLSSWELLLNDSQVKDDPAHDISEDDRPESVHFNELRDTVDDVREMASNSSSPRFKDRVLTLGCVGYPNVGKSSVLNALVSRKVVSVSQTPGHTKHFQTIYLCPTVRLCDCPGLVFPSLVPKSLQVVAGIFPVAQVREPYSVVAYLAKRLDLPSLLCLKPPYSSPKKKDKNTGQYIWSAMDICEAWAVKNGFSTAKAGRPDVYRAANKILRLAVEGQLCLSFRPLGYYNSKDKLVNNPEVLELATLLVSHGRSCQLDHRDTDDHHVGVEDHCCSDDDGDDDGDDELPEEAACDVYKLNCYVSCDKSKGDYCDATDEEDDSGEDSVL